MMRDAEIDKRLHALDWKVLRFWGMDIQKNLEACTSDVQSAILEDIIQQNEEKAEAQWL